MRLPAVSYAENGEAVFMGEYLKRNGRLLLAAVVIVLFCAALPQLFAAGKAIETGSWGLSFREEGKRAGRKRQPAGARELRRGLRGRRKRKGDLPDL